jgi:S-formylglutathione hydrolase FrmB
VLFDTDRTCHASRKIGSSRAIDVSGAGGKTGKGSKMRKMHWISLIVLFGLPLSQAHAQGWRKDSKDLSIVNTKLAGKVVDYTANHGADHRIWSPSLYQRRDLYVYLPPGYDPGHRYPFMIWLHGFCQDEKSFLYHIAPVIDDAICSGKLPPLIVAAPDGSLSGEPRPSCTGSFFLNSSAGDFADFVLQDVFDFVCAHFSIRPERDAHIIAGCSMGGFAAFNYAIKHREAFGVVIGISPLLNLRWQNKSGDYFAKFNPRDWGWCSELGSSGQVVCRFLDGGRRVCLKHWLETLYGPGEGGLSMIALENPIEMVDRFQLRPGELEMYVAYTGDDEFNTDSQVESFLYLSRWRGLHVGVGFQNDGRHNIRTFAELLPGALQWLTPRLAPFSTLMPADCVVNVGPPPIVCVGAQCPPESKGPLWPNVPGTPAKHRPWLGNHRATGSQCDDLNCHLPPLWLPDCLTEEGKK